MLMTRSLKVSARESILEDSARRTAFRKFMPKIRNKTLRMMVVKEKMLGSRCHWRENR